MVFTAVEFTEYRARRSSDWFKLRSGDRDFVIAIDGNPEDVSEPGISTAQVLEWLRDCGRIMWWMCHRHAKY